MRDFFVNLWSSIVIIYGSYSAFIHSILPNEAGDFTETLIDALLAILLVRLIAGVAFKRD